MASRIRDLLIMFLPVEWRGGGISVAADTAGPPGTTLLRDIRERTGVFGISTYSNCE
jgi:hypothetical protein